MQQLLGEFECKMDAKGRMRLPSGLIAQLGEEKDQEFVINRGFEKCLMLYPIKVWERISSEVNQLNQYVRKNREFVRYFYRGAQQLEMDSADRILVNKRLLEWAGIDKEVILSAYNDRIELWAKERYDLLLEEEPADFAGLAEEVLGKTEDQSAGT
jgi:MraZ protein